MAQRRGRVGLICVLCLVGCAAPSGAGSSSEGGASGSGPATTGGVATGGSSTGGVATGGSSTGGVATGGSSTGGVATGGNSTGGSTTGGATGGSSTGGSATGGASSGGSSTGGVGGIAGTARCKNLVTDPLPAGAPTLKAGTWTDVTPASLVGYEGTNQTMIAQGMAIDPCNPAVLYWGTTPFDTSKGGLFKSTNGGGTWTKIGTFDSPVHVRVDPENTQRLYVGDGVRGATQGFWVSTDGGATWAKPDGFAKICDQMGIPSSCGMNDIYDVAPDPTNFDHVLLSFHSPWSWGDSSKGAGILESTDAGKTWTAHHWPNQMGYGHSIDFLYEPDQGIGNAATWIWGTQGGGGYWRTTDSGATWTKVSTNSIMHGGGTTFYAKTGTLFASGTPSNMLSTDNGITWSFTGPGNSTAVFGDGTLLYSAPALGDNPFFTSPETDGKTWTPFGGGKQTWHNGGPYEMAFDPVHRIIYSSDWEMGIWALKLAP